MVLEPAFVEVRELLFCQFRSDFLHFPSHCSKPLRVDFLNHPPGVRKRILNLKESPVFGELADSRLPGVYRDSEFLRYLDNVLKKLL